MLPKTNRLTKKKDFDLAFKNGKSLRGDFLMLKVFKNNFKHSRIGFVVSKKVSKKASVRNKIKRRLRAAVLSQLENIKKPADIIILSLPIINKKDFSQIKEEVIKLFENV